MSPQDGYDAPLSALRNHVEDLAVALAIWEARREAAADSHARRAGSTAIDAVDASIGELYKIRQQLISEVQQADRANAARVDALLARTADAMSTQTQGRPVQETEGPGGEARP